MSFIIDHSTVASLSNVDTDFTLSYNCSELDNFSISITNSTSGMGTIAFYASLDDIHYSAISPKVNYIGTNITLYDFNHPEYVWIQLAYTAGINPQDLVIKVTSRSSTVLSN